MARANKFTKDDLAQRMSWPLEDKIQHSRRMIRQWIDFWDEQGYGVYVSFSGGKDSTVLLDLVRSVDPTVPAVFSDTGLEFPEIKEFVRSFDNVEVVRPEMSFRQVLNIYGYPVTIRRIAKMLRWQQNPSPENYASRMTTWTGINHGKYGKYAGKKTYGTGVLSLKYRHLIGLKLPKPGNCLKCPLGLEHPSCEQVCVDPPFKISDQCCNIMKHRPLDAYHEATGRLPIIGLTAGEGDQRQKRWLKFGCNAFDPTGREMVPNSAPMSIWTSQDVMAYIVVRGLPIASVYGDIVGGPGYFRTTGERRTGCIFCGFALEQELAETGTHRFIRLRQTHPKLWEYCMDDLGMREVLLYLGFATGD